MALEVLPGSITHLKKALHSCSHRGEQGACSVPHPGVQHPCQAGVDLVRMDTNVPRACYADGEAGML